MKTFINRRNPECVITRLVDEEQLLYWLCANGEVLRKWEWHQVEIWEIPVAA